MCAKIKFLAVVAETKKASIVYRAFFFCKKTGYLLPIRVNREVVEFLVRKRGKGINRTEYAITNLLKSINANKIMLIKNGQKYETVLKVKGFLWKKEIRTPFYYGFMYSNICKYPMEIDESTLRKYGTKITRELLNSSLLETINMQSIKNTRADI